jgi:peptide/nickel transport system substrate-binding protein
MSNKKDEITVFVSRRGFLGTGMGIAGLAALAACGDAAGSGTKSAYSIPKATQPFVHARPTDVISLDPANTLGDSDQDISHSVYERLLAPKWKPEDSDGDLLWDGLAGSPQLATSWDINGPVITFHLRTDVKFYPTGNPLTAEDVRYSFERLTKIVGNGQFQAGVAGLYDASQVKVIDTHTVQITFTDPTGKPTAVPVDLPSMRFQQFAIIDSVEVKKHVTASDPYASNWLKTNLATSGPYYIESRIPNQQIVLKAVPNHWTGPGYTEPYYKTVVIRYIGAADVVALMKSGSVDYVGNDLTARQITNLGSSGFQVRHANVPDIMRLSFAYDAGPTADKAVRQALMHAVPYNEIITTALAGEGTRATSFVNPDDPDGTNNWTEYDYDPAKAKSLLAAAGKSDLPSIDMWYTADFAYYQDIALLIKASMAQAGVTVNLKPTPGTKLQTMAAQRAARPWGPTSMNGMYLSDAIIWLDDPETHIDLWGKSTSPFNWSRYYNPLVDKLHAEYRNEPNNAPRIAAYKEIQAILADAAVVNPIIVLGRTVITPPGLQGINFMWGAYAMYEYIRPVGAAGQKILAAAVAG